MKRRSHRAIVGAIILSKTGIHFVALVLFNVQSGVIYETND